MNILMNISIVLFIFGVAIIFYTIIDVMYSLFNDESPFNLVEKDIELFDREDK